jgi:hypothetical protein
MSVFLLALTLPLRVASLARVDQIGSAARARTHGVTHAVAV